MPDEEPVVEPVPAHVAVIARVGVQRLLVNWALMTTATMLRYTTAIGMTAAVCGAVT
jgi:hypothetical protein